MKVSRMTGKTVASRLGRAHMGWIAFCGWKECDFRDNRIGQDSYFDEADMNS
jgi:hypothetical protein